MVPDPDGALFKRLTGGWVPWSILIAPDGRVVFSENEFDEGGFSSAIERLLTSEPDPHTDTATTEVVRGPRETRSGPATAVILGGGIGGVVAARRLRARLGSEHRVVLVDRAADHLFQSSLLWVMDGSRRTSQIRRALRRLRRHGIEFVQEEVVRIDVGTKRVETVGSSLSFDYLVIALGARTAPESVEGFADMAHDLYSPAGCRAIDDALEDFDGGKVGVLVTSMPFKCPAAPYEAAFLVEARLRRKGIRERSQVHLYTPEHQPMPVTEASLGGAVVEMLRARGIEYHPLFTFERMRPDAGQIVDAEGRSESVDLLIAVPPHEVPEVVRSSGLAGLSGWIHVDPETLRTEHPGVYAIGDVTTVRLPSGKSLPKAGVFAHHQAEVVAEEIAAEMRSEPPRARFDGDGACWIEIGDGRAGFARGNFYGGAEPSMELAGPSRFRHWTKVAFEKWWLWRWF